MMIKYTTALKTGTADADALLQRFTRSNLQHPTYQGLCELGRAIKTIFLCEYLSSQRLRQEIQEALNVIEQWNSVNGFIFSGSPVAVENCCRIGPRIKKSRSYAST